MIDLQIAFWLVALFYFLYKARNDKRYILPSIVTALICFITKETSFFAVPIILFVNILFVEKRKFFLASLTALVIGLFILGVYGDSYITSIRGYSSFLSLDKIEEFTSVLGNILSTNFYLLFNIYSWSYEKCLVILSCLVFGYIIIKNIYYRKINVFEVSLTLISILYYLALLYFSPLKVSLNLGWRYLLPSIFSLLTLFGIFLADLVHMVNNKLSTKLVKLKFSNSNRKIAVKTVIALTVIGAFLLPTYYYAISEIQFYDRYVRLTRYTYDSLRVASVKAVEAKQADETSILCPYVYSVSIWTGFEFSSYYPFPESNDTLIELLDLYEFDYIIVSEWWVYHPFKLFKANYTLIYSVTDAHNRTTRLYTRT